MFALDEERAVKTNRGGTMEASRSGRATKRAPSLFSELSIVALSHAVETDGGVLPAGTVGTVVATYDDGDGYEIEVHSPFHAVITVGTDDLTV